MQLLQKVRNFEKEREREREYTFKQIESESNFFCIGRLMCNNNDTATGLASFAFEIPDETAMSKTKTSGKRERDYMTVS